MTAGGYIFRKVDLTYDPNTNGATVLDWAKAIHEARCQAFFDAAKAYYTSLGEPYGWYTLGSSVYGNTYPTIQLGSSTPFITQDIHDSSSQGSTYADKPALLTVFTNEVSGSYYCILTYTGFNNYYQNDPLNYGLYLPQVNVLQNTSTQFCCGGSLSHCYAKSGGITTAPINIKNDNFLINNCTNIMAAYYSVYGYASGYTQDSTSLLYDRIYNGQNSSNLVGKTFQFGYAIKDEQIISMMRISDSSRWLWSIIGDIFDVTMSAEDKCLVGCLVNNYDYYGEISSVQSPSYIQSEGSGRISFCKSNGDLYRPNNYQRVCLDYSRSISFGLFPSIRTNNIIPDDTLYNAVTAGAYANTYSITTGDTGVDGQGNGCKGFIDTDLLRMVSASVCQNAGTLFNGGNFVSMQSPNSGCQVGYILGWDPSNESIM